MPYSGPEDVVQREYGKSAIRPVAYEGDISVDETSITSLLTMCDGALDDLQKIVFKLTEKLDSIIYHGEPPNTSISRNHPDADSMLGNQIVGTYQVIIHIDDQLTDLLNKIRL